MPNRPSFQFYPKDWLGNKNLRSATFALRGLWIDVMCLLHDSDEYGLLRWDLDRIAASLNCHVSQLKSLANHRILKGATAGETAEPVDYVDTNRVSHSVLLPQPGPVWFSSRMLVDEYKRNLQSEYGRKGGNPTLKAFPQTLKGRVKGRDNPTSSPSSTTSHSCIRKIFADAGMDDGGWKSLGKKITCAAEAQWLVDQSKGKKNPPGWIIDHVRNGYIRPAVIPQSIVRRWANDLGLVASVDGHEVTDRIGLSNAWILVGGAKVPNSNLKLEVIKFKNEETA